MFFYEKQYLSVQYLSVQYLSVQYLSVQYLSVNNIYRQTTIFLLFAIRIVELNHVTLDSGFLHKFNFINANTQIIILISRS